MENKRFVIFGVGLRIDFWQRQQMRLKVGWSAAFCVDEKM
jgi:hypothetical protein